MMQKPDVEHIDGLSPAISIEQKTTSRNPRSTVATVTEIYDYMRLLWARVGIPYSPATGLPITAQTVSQMVDRVMALPEGNAASTCSPRSCAAARASIARSSPSGRRRASPASASTAIFHEIEDAPALDKNFKHDIEVVVDRIVVREGIEPRLADSFETALKLAEGLAFLDPADPPEDPPGSERTGVAAALEKAAERNVLATHAPEGRIIFSEKFACPVSGFTIAEIEPRLFSFNAPQGACPACDGLGEKLIFDEDLVVPNHNLSIAKGAVVPWAKSQPPSPYYMQVLSSLARAYDFDLDTPWKDLPEEAQRVILHGTDGRPVTLRFIDGRRSYEVKKPFEGVIGNLNRRMLSTESAWMREELSRYQSSLPCEVCHGARLRPEPLAVKIAGEDISDVVPPQRRRRARLVLDARGQAQPDPARDRPRHPQGDQRAPRLPPQCRPRLSPPRPHQRHAVGRREPAHPPRRRRSAPACRASSTSSTSPRSASTRRDNDRLLDTLKRLRDLGNTVLVVEHDEEAIRAADYLIDMGPGAGVHGGEVVCAGSLDDLLACDRTASPPTISPAAAKSRSAPRAARERENSSPSTAPPPTTSRTSRSNSRSAPSPASPASPARGKSLAHRRHALRRRRPRPQRRPHPRRRARQASPASNISTRSSTSTSRRSAAPRAPTPRPIPAPSPRSATGSPACPKAKARGYKPGRFSFNVKGGRCEACQGDGLIKIEMHFLPDVYVTCDVCHGARYNRETLEVKFKGRSIADVLDMTVEDAAEFFKAVPGIRDKMRMLQEVGLGYVKVGQQATTLSGGEAQRVKLSKELSRRATGKTLYILDEPTTGLHFEDVRKLLDVLHRLVEQGNTVVVIEHNLDVIKTADWVVDLGPGGGVNGGRIIAEGPPERIAEDADLGDRVSICGRCWSGRAEAGGGGGCAKRPSARGKVGRAPPLRTGEKKGGGGIWFFII